jgi:hypothetical protein
MDQTRDPKPINIRIWVRVRDSIEHVRDSVEHVRDSIEHVRDSIEHVRASVRAWY